MQVIRRVSDGATLPSESAIKARPSRAPSSARMPASVPPSGTAGIPVVSTGMMARHGTSPLAFAAAPPVLQMQDNLARVEVPAAPVAPAAPFALEAPRPVEAPAAKPAAPPPPKAAPAKPSFFSKIKAHGQTLLVLFLAGAGYAAYHVHDLHRPYVWTGTVEAHQIALGSLVGGRVKEVLVHEGDEVVAGQPLVTLDDAEHQILKRIAETELETNEATLAKLERGARDEELSQAKARVSTMGSGAASASLMRIAAEAELRRTKNLFAAGAASKAELEQREAALRAAEVEASKASASIAEASAAFQLVKGGTRAEDLRVARASVARERERVKSVMNRLDEHVIRAPRAARIESINVRQGDILAANGTAVSVIEKGELFVRLYVPETQIGKAPVGTEVPFSIDSYPGRRFVGKVTHVNSIGEFMPRTMITSEDRADQVFGTRIAITDGDNLLRAGMVATAQIKK